MGTQQVATALQPFAGVASSSPQVKKQWEKGSGMADEVLWNDYVRTNPKH